MTHIHSEIIRCRSQAGTAIRPAKPWASGEPVSFIYAPEGLHTITAGFRANDTITITVDVDEETPAVLQESFDHLTATTAQEPFADEDHEGRKATLRFPASTRFSWGTLRGTTGVIVSGVQPTSYGAESVNGKVYRSWSPEFLTDAAMDKAECERGHWSFPPYARGSSQSPARLVGVNFVVGALTNRPAFRAMPVVKARQADPSRPCSPQVEAVFAALSRRRAAETLVTAKLLEGIQTSE